MSKAPTFASGNIVRWRSTEHFSATYCRGTVKSVSPKGTVIAVTDYGREQKFMRGRDGGYGHCLRLETDAERERATWEAEFRTLRAIRFTSSPSVIAEINLVHITKPEDLRAAIDQLERAYELILRMPPHCSPWDGKPYARKDSE